MKMRLLLLVFILFLSVPLHSDDASVGRVLIGWEALAYGAAIVSFVFAILALMIGRAFDLRNITQAAKTELIYIFSTILLIMMLGVFVTTGSDLLYELSTQLLCSSYSNVPSFQQAFPDCELYVAPPPVYDYDSNGGRIEVTLKPHVIDVAKLYLQPVVLGAQTSQKILYGLSIPVEAMASIYVEIFMSEHASGFGFKPFAERIKNTNMAISFYLFAYYLIIHILNFIRAYGLFFLSIGVILRCFPPTRGAGAYVIALTLGLYFVFPFSFVMASAVSAGYSFEQSFLGFGGGKNLIFALPFELPENSKICNGMDSSSVVDAIQYFKANKSDIFNIMDVISLNVVKAMTLRICLLPLVALTVTFTFILSTTNLFGGNIPEIGRGLVKLI
ncbi:MAG: hypothetical protein ABII22_02615 [Candidatus Micrarchaeota archaeon]